jgi:SP family facilitated glucose transporter-like MFS transporter 8
VSEPRIRGLLGASFSLILILGILTVNIVGTYYSIYTSAVIFLACSAVFLVLFSVMPESSFYLITKNRIQEARSSAEVASLENRRSRTRLSR